MGAWGTGLYQDDVAMDVRDTYKDQLHRGKTGEEITQELMEDYEDLLDDMEDGPVFWFALADTQWALGRLEDDVKGQALFYLENGGDAWRWEMEGAAKVRAREKVLQKLKEKLNTPQPPKKKVSQYRLYQCKWNLGDVFAYCFDSEYSKQNGFYGQYVVFRKVSEDTWHPGHIVPIVQIYKWIGYDIPAIDELKNYELLPAFYKPEALPKLSKPLDHEIKLLSESEKSIPTDKLTFLGNLPGSDLIPFLGHDYWTGYYGVGWENGRYPMTFERYVIDMYLAWKGN